MRFEIQASRFTSAASPAAQTLRAAAPSKRRAGEQGYMLLGAIIAVAIVMIALSVAVTAAVFELRREREEESVRRANQYVRAIREYYLKFGHYPASFDQLENTNNIRFLRQKYVDPLTGKADYRAIIVGQNKTTVKGFFGQPLSGLPAGGVGAPGSGTGTGTGTGAAGSGAGGAAGGILGAIFGGGAATNATGAAGAAGTAGAPGAGGAGTGAGTGTTGASGATSGAASPTTAQPGSQPGTGTTSGPGGSLGPIMGVGSTATGDSIVAVNGQTTYQTWEFLYDPRIEQLKGAAALNSGAQSGGANQNPAGLGGGLAPAGTNPNGVNPPTPGQTGTSPTGPTSAAGPNGPYRTDGAPANPPPPQ